MHQKIYHTKYRLIRLILFFLILTTGLLNMLSPVFVMPAEAGGAGTDDGEVVIVQIRGQIDPGMYNYVQRTFNAAKEAGSPPLIMLLSTPGGYINSALDMRDLMDEYPGPVYAYVRHQAISAGAYLALAADSLYMSPGGTMGAAEPRGLTGGQVDEKSLSVWEGEMQGVAERRQRDPDIAAAMVRRDIIIEDLVEDDQLLTLTSEEAEKVGYSEGTADSIDELLNMLGLESAGVQESSSSLFDLIISWTTNPIIATLLLAVGIGGLVLEMFTMGFGVAGSVGILAFALYYSGHILGGLAGFEVLVLFVAGVALLLVEAFMPGLGVFGAAGTISLFVSIVMAASTVESGITMLLVSMLLSGFISFFALRFLSRKGVLRKIILEEAATGERGYVSTPSRKDLEGQEGEALTTLRPAGTVSFGDQRVDAVSEGKYIQEGARVKVVRVEGVRVVVREISND